MASGKQTPRQKMIAMMYLVLTAMLALNVSAEVLEAFVLVDNGLNQTLKSFNSKNENYYDLIKSAENNNPEKAAKWREKADVVKAKSKELYDYIEGIKKSIVETSDGKDAEAITKDGIDGHKVKSKSDTSIPANILLGPNADGEAYKLRTNIAKFREEMVALVGTNDKFGPSESIKKILDTENPPMTADGTHRTWETSRFEQIPLISTLPLLSKFQVDVLNCEAILLDYFFKQIDAADVRVNMFDVVLVPEATTILTGEKYKATLMLAAYDKTQQPIMRINGTPISVAEGKGTYEVMGTSIGEKELNCEIEVKGPDGVVTPYRQSFKYRVIPPMYTVSPTKMNVLYRGIENPMDVSVSGVSSDKVEVRITNADFRSYKIYGSYLVKPLAGSTCEVNVFANINGQKKLMGSSVFRVKPLPPPVARLDGATSKVISKSVLNSSLGIRAEMPQDFDFDLRYTVKSFVITGKNSDGFDIDETSNSSAFTERQKKLLSNMRSGSRLVISDIKAAGPDGKLVDLEMIGYKIK